MFKPAELFDLAQTEHAALFDGVDNAWEALKRIAPYLAAWKHRGQQHRALGRVTIGEQVTIGEGTVIEDGALIVGPAIIGRNCQIRHNAYIRENVIVGDDCVVGNACELKNTLLFNGAQVPHFNYVGDSLLGYKAHLGAGVKVSNLKLLPGNVTILVDGQKLDTGLRKFGAILGDCAEAGCNAVLNPGTILGPGAMVYPNVFWRGVLPAGHIAKNRAEVEVVARREK